MVRSAHTMRRRDDPCRRSHRETGAFVVERAGRGCTGPPGLTAREPADFPHRHFGGRGPGRRTGPGRLRPPASGPPGSVLAASGITDPPARIRKSASLTGSGRSGGCTAWLPKGGSAAPRPVPKPGDPSSAWAIGDPSGCRPSRARSRVAQAWVNAPGKGESLVARISGRSRTSAPEEVGAGRDREHEDRRAGGRAVRPRRAPRRPPRPGAITRNVHPPDRASPPPRRDEGSPRRSPPGSPPLRGPGPARTAPRPGRRTAGAS